MDKWIYGYICIWYINDRSRIATNPRVVETLQLIPVGHLSIIIKNIIITFRGLRKRFS